MAQNTSRLGSDVGELSLPAGTRVPTPEEEYRTLHGTDRPAPPEGTVWSDAWIPQGEREVVHGEINAPVTRGAITSAPEPEQGQVVRQPIVQLPTIEQAGPQLGDREVFHGEINPPVTRGTIPKPDLPYEPGVSPTPAPAPSLDFGNRADGTVKGNGFLGVLQRPDGGVSTELSIGVEFDGKEMQIPTLVPTLDRNEIDYLLNTPPSPEIFKSELGKTIMKKAVSHAQLRIRNGKSPFAQGVEPSSAEPVERKPLMGAGGGFDYETPSVGEVAGVISDAIDRLPGEIASAGLSAVRGGKIGVGEKEGWSDKLIKEQQEEARAASEGVSIAPLVKLPLIGNITAKDISELPSNLGFSAVSALAGLIAAIPLAAVPEPTGATKVAAWAVGTAASGAVAYRMAKDQFTGQLFEMLNDQVIQERGAPLTQEEWEPLRLIYEHKADKYGLWEAIPEALGNAFTLGIIRLPVAKLLKLPGVMGQLANISADVIKRAGVKSPIAKKLLTGAGKLAAIQAEELGTETVTQKGQAGIEKEVGLRETVPTWGEAFKEVAPKTALLTGVMAGGGAVGSHIYDKAKGPAKPSPEAKPGVPTAPPTAPTATFQYFGPMKGGTTPQYEITGGPDDGSSTDAKGLAQRGIEVPETPTHEDWVKELGGEDAVTQLMTYVGERGATEAEHAALLSAKTESDAGGDASRGGDLHKKHGWFLAPDKKWRLEIPDNEIMWNYDRAFQGTPYKLSAVMQHPELFKRFPILDKLYVFPQDLNSSGKYESPYKSTEEAQQAIEDGVYDVGEIKIHSGVGDMRVRDEFERVLIHETQHAVQLYEGFALGADVGYAKYQESLGELEAIDVYKRLRMTPEERAKVPPYSSFGIPDSELDIAFVPKGRSALPDAAPIIRKGVTDRIKRLTETLKRTDLTPETRTELTQARNELRGQVRGVKRLKTDIANVQKRMAEEPGYELSDDYKKQLKRFGHHLDGHKVRHKVPFSVGANKLYGMPQGIKPVQISKTVEHPLTGPRVVTVTFVPGKGGVQEAMFGPAGRHRQSYKQQIIDAPIFSESSATRAREIDAIVAKNRKYTNWYEEWHAFMRSFEKKGVSASTVTKHIKIQAILSAGQSPQLNQLSYTRVVNLLEAGERDPAKFAEAKTTATKAQLKHILKIWDGKDGDINTLEKRIAEYDAKVGAYMTVGLNPRDPDAVVIDRHMARPWGYNVMWDTEGKSKRWSVPAEVRKVITDDIIAAAKRNDMSPGAVQAAIWFEVRPARENEVERYSEAYRVSPEYRPQVLDAVEHAASTYERAKAKPGKNVYIRDRKAAPDNSKRVLLVQVSTDLSHAARAKGVKTKDEIYYDKLYAERAGYVRPTNGKDFWELPEWIPIAANTLTNSDVYIVRDMAEAHKFLIEAGYPTVVFGTMDANRKLIHDLVSSYPGRAILGGYAQKEYFADLPNAEWHDNMESMAKALGYKYEKGASYRHFKGTETIPRLCMSTGCSYNCAFCPIPQEVVATDWDTVEQQTRAFKDLEYELVYLNDKTFGQAPNYRKLADVNRILRHDNPNFKGFIIQTTAVDFLKLDDKWLDTSGIKYVEFGVESFNDPILANIRKPHRTKHIVAAIAKLRKRGDMALIPNIMVGLAGTDKQGRHWEETAETYENTRNFLLSNTDVISHVNEYNLAIMAGTDLAKQIAIREEIDIDQNVVENTYHKNPKPHKEFGEWVADFGMRMLDKDPLAREGEIKLAKAQDTEIAQTTTYRPRGTITLPRLIAHQVATHNSNPDITKRGSSVNQTSENLFGKPFYAVSIHSDFTMRFKGGTLTPAHLAQYYAKWGYILEANPEFFVGTWYNAESKETWADISVAVPKDRKQDAVRFGKLWNQIAMYDLETGEEISLGGTGISKPMSPAQRDQEIRTRFLLARQLIQRVPKLTDAHMTLARKAQEIVRSQVAFLGLTKAELDKVQLHFLPEIFLTTQIGDFWKSVEEHGLGLSSLMRPSGSTSTFRNRETGETTHAIVTMALLKQTPARLTRTAIHEFWHVVEALGLITQSEQTRLNALVPNAEDRANLAVQVVLDPNSKISVKQTNFVRGIFIRIARFLDRIAAKLGSEHARLKIKESPTDVIAEVVNRLRARDNALLRTSEHAPTTQQAEMNTKFAKAAKEFAQTPEFKKWFKGSVVVDANGDPLVVYHGTVYARFKEFTFGGNSGYHFGSAAQASDRVSVKIKDKQGRNFFEDKLAGSVVPAYLSIKNPFVMTDPREWEPRDDDAWEYIDKAISAGSGDSQFTQVTESDIESIWDKGFYTWLSDKGYDGIKYRNDYEGSDRDWSWVALNRNQIKSVFNRGTWSTTDPRISFSQQAEMNTKFAKLAKAAKEFAQTPEFKKWFGKSKVVDESGEPLVVYHGTSNVYISTFRTPSWFGDPTVASFYSRIVSSEDYRGQSMYPVFLSISNPYITYNPDEAYYDPYDKAWVKQKIKEGYDGVMLRLPEEEIIEVYVAFSPTQIKSIFNRGTWSTTDPRISFSQQERAVRMRGVNYSTAAEDDIDCAIAKIGVRYFEALDFGVPEEMAVDDMRRRLAGLTLIAKSIINSTEKLGFYKDARKIKLDAARKKLEALKSISGADVMRVPDISPFDVFEEGGGAGVRSGGLFVPEFTQFSVNERAVVKFAKSDSTSRTPVPWAHSQLLRAVTEAGDQMPAKTQSLKNWLLRYAKPTELAWMGVDDWIADNQVKGKVDRAAFVEFLRANQIELDEIVIGEGESAGAAKIVESEMHWGDSRRLDPSQENIDAYIEYWTEEDSEYAPVDKADFTTGDGWFDEDGYMQALTEHAYENFYEFGESNSMTERESGWEIRYSGMRDAYSIFDDNGTFVEQLDIAGTPGRQSTISDAQDRVLELLVERGLAVTAEQLEEQEVPAFGKYTLPGGTEYREMLVTWECDWGECGPDYASPHWRTPNVLAHVRYKTRYTASGERVLFIEELQSDWLQEAKKKGFAPSEEEYDKAHNEWRLSGDAARVFVNAMAEKYKYQVDIPGLLDRMSVEDRAEYDRLQEDHLRTEEAKNKLLSSVPRAPFLNNWHELMLKRMLRYAAENGFAHIAWTTGAQQSDRYNLRNHIQSIVYSILPHNEVASDPEFQINIQNRLGYEIYDVIPPYIHRSEFAHYFGPEIASRMTGTSGTLYGVDLEVGGEGMIEFYDNKLVGFAKKYGKQWGAQPATIEVETGEAVSGPKRTSWEHFITPRVSVHSLPVTDTMRDSVIYVRQTFFSVSTPRYRFQDTEFQDAIDAASQTTTPHWYTRLLESLSDLKNKATRELEHLPRVPKFAQVRFDLLRMAKNRSVSSDLANTAIRSIMEPLFTRASWIRRKPRLNQEAYNLFVYKVVLSDLYETALAARTTEDPDLQKEILVAFGKSEKDLAFELRRLNKHITTSHPEVHAAFLRRDAVWKTIKSQYIRAMSSIGLNVSDRLKRKDYFKHRVLEYIDAKGLMGTGKKLSVPRGRAYLKHRGVNQHVISTDYVGSESEVMAQMMYDIEIAKVLAVIDSQHNIIGDLRAMAKSANKNTAKQIAAQRGVPLRDIHKSDLEEVDAYMTWEDFLPHYEKTHTLWNPEAGQVFHMASSIPESLARKLMEEGMTSLGITRDQLRKIPTLSQKREWVIPIELANTLDRLYPQRSENVIFQAHRKLVRAWKVWQLVSPGRWFKYNARNLTGDADVMFAGNPHAFRKVPQAVHDIWMAVYKHAPPKEFRDWTKRGGNESTLQAQEMGEFNILLERAKVGDPKRFLSIPSKIWGAYWKAARLSTDFRESILRYAAYLDYLESIEKSATGKPRNFGASLPSEILALKDPRDRAFWLSNDLLGAYDRVSVMGQALREQMWPFWSWKEVNMRRYIQMARNASSNRSLCALLSRQVLGKAVVRSPYLAYRVGSFLIKAVAFSAMLQVWNRYGVPDNDDDLPEDVRDKPHITLWRDGTGKVQYFSRLGALSDLLEWFGLDTAPRHVKEWMEGRRSLREVAKEIYTSPLNVVVGGMEPISKMAYELITRRSLFPDVLRQRTIRDRAEYVANSFGLGPEYAVIAGKPSRKYGERIKNLFVYSSDPPESAYWYTKNLIREWQKAQGKPYGDGFFITDAGNALYDVKRAARYGDTDAFVKYLFKYAEIKVGQGKSISDVMKSMERSFLSMEPGYGMKDLEKAAFVLSLNDRDRQKVAMSFRYYQELVSSKITLSDLQKRRLVKDLTTLAKTPGELTQVLQIPIKEGEPQKPKPESPKTMRELRKSLRGGK